MYTIEFLIGQDWHRTEETFELEEGKELAKKLSEAKNQDHGYAGRIILDGVTYKTSYYGYIAKGYIRTVRLTEVKKPLTINTKSWHYKFFNSMWNKNPKTHCGYFWKGLFTLLATIIGLVGVSSVIAIIGADVLAAFGITGGVVFTGVAGFFAGLGLVLVVGGSVAAIGGIVWVIYRSVVFLVEKYQDRKLDKELEKFDVKVDRDDKPEIKIYTSFKNKHCALVKYE